MRRSRCLDRGLTTFVLLALGLGCGDATTLTPVIDLPDESSDAFPFDGQTEDLVLSLARAGVSEPLTQSQAQVGDSLALTDAPRETNVVVHLSGLLAGSERAYGRTCNLDLIDISEPEPHLYFSRVARWGTAPRALAPRAKGTLAFADRVGDAIIVGGDDEGSIERFDALSGAYLPVAGDLVVRTGAVVGRLGDGRAVIIGGVNVSGDGVETIEVLAPEPERLPEPGPRLRAHAAASLASGAVLVAGGEEQGADGQEFFATDVARLLTVGTGAIVEAPTALSSTLESPRSHHSMTTLDSDVVLIGGLDDTGAPVPGVELYRDRERRFVPLPGETLERWDHRATRLGEGILIVGGYQPDLVGGVMPASDLLLYDPRTNEFTAAGAAPAGSAVVGFTLTPLPDGGVLVSGGEDSSGEPLRTAFIVRFDEQGRVLVSTTSPMAEPRSHHVAVALCDGTILIVGGDTAGSSERYNPSSTGRR